MSDDEQLRIQARVSANLWAAVRAALGLAPVVDSATVARVAFGRIAGMADRDAARATGGPPPRPAPPGPAGTAPRRG